MVEALPARSFAVRYSGGTVAGWVSVLLSLKAWVDFGGDPRTQDQDRNWDTGYAEK